MRLLSRLPNGTFSLTHDYVENLPCYAILSHTWGKDVDEVVFDDLKSINQNTNKVGYRKLEFCATQAAKDGLQYFWVDTCCINKASHAELAEAIASMFRWYQNASKCYVYMPDVSTDDLTVTLRKSRWFTRGWTLQELLAPRIVEFFSGDGERFGDKLSLEQTIHEVTRIPLSAIRGEKGLHDFTIEERIAWASNRKTTRKEDAAYCLQGIFGVFIPLIYGEGDHAWVRLKRAIAESQNPNWFQTPLIARSADEDDDRIQETLAFPEMHDRRLKVEPRHEHTCEWVLDVPSFKQWLPASQGLLWIKGKPGSGKSTLMAYLYDELAKRTAVPVVRLDFFLTARGSELQRTFQGLLRSLVSQLFFQDPATREQIRLIYQSKKAAFGNSKTSWVWQQAELETMFSGNVVHLARQQSVTVFVDALDESGESSARTMAEYFHKLNNLAIAEQAQLKICISCRHYPIVTSRIYSLEIVVEHHNNEDIRTFIHDKLYLDNATLDDPSDDWQALKIELTERAQGVFQWAHVVTPLVQKYIDNAETPGEVRKKLQHVPAELKSVYSYILQTVIDETDRESAIRLFRWVCLARRPLTLIELRYAMATDDSNQDFTTNNPRWIGTDERMKRRAKAISGGLVEVVSQRSQGHELVQVGHQSVTDFMLSTGLTLLFEWVGSSPIPPDMTCWSHARIYWSCLIYMANNQIRVLGAVHDLRDNHQAHRISPVSNPYDRMKVQDRNIKKKLRDDLPLLEYAVHNIFIHASMARQSRSNDLEKEVPIIEAIVPCWINLKFEIFGASSWSWSSSSLLHIASFVNLIDVVRYLSKTTTDLDLQDFQRRTPLHLATESGNQEIVEYLVSSGANINVIDFSQGTPLLYATRGSHTALVKWLLEHGARVNPETDVDRDALGVAAGLGNIDVVRMLIRYGAKINASARSYGTPLCAAISAGHEHIAKLLVESGADIKAQSSLDSPLCIASAKGQSTVVGFLLNKGVSVDSADRNGSALSAASSNGHIGVVKMLLTAGSDVNLPQHGVFPSALFAATKRDHPEIVKLLIESGANVNSDTKNGHKSSPLTVACEFASQEVVQLLVDAGADVKALGPRGVPLVIAIRKKRDEVIKMLLAAGADPNQPGLPPNPEYTPIYVAKYFNYQNIVQLLLDNGAT